MAITTLVVDDEKQARVGLRGLLEAEPKVDLLGECAGGRAAVDIIQVQQPDLVFLDVQMPGMDGFEVLNALDEENLPFVIFVTAYDQYALRAFEIHAVDYLLKPFTNRRFREALERVKRRIKRKDVISLNENLSRLIDHLEEDEGYQTTSDYATTSDDKYLRRVGITQRDRTRLIELDKVGWIEASDNYAQLHTGEQSHLLRTTLNELEGRLDPRRFLRVHRSYIVNIDQVRAMQSLGSGDALLILDDGTEVRSSRSYRAERQRLFGE